MTTLLCMTSGLVTGAISYAIIGKVTWRTLALGALWFTNGMFVALVTIYQ